MPKQISFYKYFNEELRTRRRAVLVKQKIKEKYVIDLLDENGNAINIDSLATEYSQAFLQPKLTFREASMIENTVVVDDTAIIEDIDNGVISFFLPDEVRKDAGIYHAELGLLGTNGEDLYAVNSFYVYVEPTNWTAVERTLPRVDEIRISLRDSSHIENELISNYEFDLAEIAYAAARTVQYWNEIPPPVSFYTTRNFPFKNLWLTGIQLFLFESLEEHYRRNHLQYSAGGLTVDDKNKFHLYRAAWQDRFQRFLRDMQLQKVRINTSVISTTTGPGFLHQL